MVKRHLPVPHEFFCITDQFRVATELGCGIIPLQSDLPRWWGKMQLFDERWRNERVLFFDLDTLIIGDLTPLAQWSDGFGICENFTRRAGHKDWSCKYGSCVMSIPPFWGGAIWRQFEARKSEWMIAAGKFGDQWAIEQIYPFAFFLQNVMPPGYFVGYRELQQHQEKPPPDCSVVIYAGGRSPDTIGPEWARKAWHD